MSHVEKYLLSAIDASTGEVLRTKWVYDAYTAECFAADWYLQLKQTHYWFNIYIGKRLRYGLSYSGEGV